MLRCVRGTHFTINNVDYDFIYTLEILFCTCRDGFFNVLVMQLLRIWKIWLRRSTSPVTWRVVGNR